MSDFPTQLLINGQWLDGSGAKRLAIVNPATEETFAEVCSATADEIGQAAEAGQAAFESGWRDMPPGERTRLLRNLAKRIHENVETLAQLETRNVGKPIGDARWEADAGAKVFDYYAGAIGHLCGQTTPVARGGLDFPLRQPMGSTEVGATIMKLAADDIKRVSLELGGKSPNIVFADADWQRAAAESPMSVFANTGQDCCARSRMFIEQSVFDGFVDQFVAATESLKIGDPMDEATQVGPMVSAAQRELSESYIAGARDAGREIRTGGDRPNGGGFYLNPAVVTGVETEDRAWREEIFGPVVCLRPFTDETEMLREVNDTNFGLSGSVWSNDLSRALRVARQVESGVISINSHSSVHTEAPFGGFKRSGLGRDLGMSAMEACTEVKNIYVGE